jgi:hypothetical protein
VPFAYRLCEFRKATRSEPPDKSCVHIARGYGLVVIRDTKQAWGSSTDQHITMSVEDFDNVQVALRSARISGPSIPGAVLEGCVLQVARLGPDRNVLSRTQSQAGDEVARTLEFTDNEVIAWLDGVRKGEFDLDTVHRAHSTSCRCAGASLTVAA